MSENTQTAEPSPLDTLLADVLQQAIALVEADQNANNSVGSSVSSENEGSANDGADNDNQPDIPSMRDSDQTDEDAVDDDTDNDDLDGDSPYEEERTYGAWNAWPHPRNYCGIRLPIGLYDPFNDAFPRNGLDDEWAERAMEFLDDTAHVTFNSRVNSICDPEADRGLEWERTWAWYYALPVDVQAEVYLQRNFDLRPGSLWIMAPHDDNLEGWERRYESRRCIIPGVEFVGMGLAYPICCGRIGAEDDGLPEWCSDPATRLINGEFNRRRIRNFL
jgi:hypothetical protein